MPKTPSCYACDAMRYVTCWTTDAISECTRAKLVQDETRLSDAIVAFPQDVYYMRVIERDMGLTA